MSFSLSISNTVVNMTETITQQSLNKAHSESVQHCTNLSKLTKYKLTWALSTALRLQEIELPNGLKLPKDGKEVAVVKNINSRRWVHGVRCITWSKPLETVTLKRGVGNFLDGLICTSPVCTWAMASTRVSLDELVVLGDAMMRRDKRLKRATLSDFVAYLRRMREWSQQHHVRTFRGYDTCRRAIRLMCENTDSSQETRTRLTLMRHRLDCPAVNFPLAIQGQQFYLDMAYPEFQVCVEYDGQFHAEQWMGDSRRRRLIENAGWQYVQVTRDDLESEKAQRELACRVATAIERNTGQRISDVCVGLSGVFNLCNCRNNNSFANKTNELENIHQVNNAVNHGSNNSIGTQGFLASHTRRVRHVTSRDIPWISPLTIREVSDIRHLRSQPRLCQRINKFDDSPN
jgi:very-short-patch-repair endonuclease